MLSEFKAFISKGNVLDLAVAVIIGAAFATIVASLTGDIIMPLVGAIFGGMDFANNFTLLGAIPDGFKGDPSSYVDLKAGGRGGTWLGPVPDRFDQLSDPRLRHLHAGTIRHQIDAQDRM